MLYKRILNTLFLVFITNLVFSQAEDKKEEPKEYIDKKLFYEQGINCTQFIKQYLSLNTLNTSNLPYLLTGNVVYRNFGLRYGLNYIMNNSENLGKSTSLSNPLPNDETQKIVSNLFTGRVGLFYYQRVNRKFIVNYGLDFLFSKDYTLNQTNNSTFNVSNSGSQNTTITTVTKARSKTLVNSLGGGPFIGIQYFFTKNVSIGTESSIYLIDSETNQTISNDFFSQTLTTFNFQGGQNNTTIVSTNTSQDLNSKQTNTNINIPLNIFLYIRF
jgi:hypothetical protein